ncbi:rod shape-determining protein MreC [Paenibacillus sp. y28]|uniref:rod shape-determining protein MreC n=1 Tax=Paenibacillus sp. y28 TaxID=3129110 RepID=UPI00301771A4
MSSLLKLFSNKRLILLLVGIMFFIALMGLSFGERSKMSWPENFVRDSMAWVQGLLYKPAGAVAGFFGDIKNLSVIYEENKALRQTLAQYARDRMRLNELEEQNERLKKALGFTESQQQANNYKWHIAEVVGMSPDPFHNNTAVINLGSKNGIKENMPVMTAEGLLGRVTHVSAFSSNVQLITDINDSNSKGISVTIHGKPDSYGVIESYDGEYLIMNKIDPNDDLQPGDTVITSGMGQLFPSGLVIGTVASRREGDFGITHTAQIKPSASFVRLREVFIVEVPELR